MTVDEAYPGSSVPNQTTTYVYGVIAGVGGNAVSSKDLLAQVIYPAVTINGQTVTPTETYTYNEQGQVKTYTDRNGTTHTYTYDDLGRQTADTVTIPAGSAVDGTVTSFLTGYDSAGNANLYTSTNNGTILNQVQQTYDGLGNLTDEYQSHSGAVNTATTTQVRYGYTITGSGQERLSSMTYPFQGSTAPCGTRVLSYNYTATTDARISRLSSISDSSGTLESYTYMGVGTVVQRADPVATLTYLSTLRGPRGIRSRGSTVSARWWSRNG